jgi:hypothetical protein
LQCISWISRHGSTKDGVEVSREDSMTVESMQDLITRECDALITKLISETSESVATASLITDEVNKLKDLLIEKNAAYGNSAAEPVRIFSKLDPLAQLYIRMDDKLSRITKGVELAGEDAKWDLAGYLILERIIKRASAK